MRVCAIASRVPLVVVLAGVAGCYSGLDGDGAGFGDGSASDSAGTDSSGETDGDSNGDGGGPANELPAPTTRFFRLTHAQWENTVQDLFYLDEPTGLSTNFRVDPQSSGYLFANNATALEVDGALWSGYQRAAVDAAAVAVADPDVMTAILPVDGGDDDTRATAFVEDFGMRAFRRPLTDAEVTEYTALWDGAGGLYEDTAGFDAGVRLAIETMLQSANFLYRVEQSTEADGDVIELGSFEVAARLSYFLWDTMPDDELYDLALADELTSAGTVEEQARRMLDSARAERVVEVFHEVIFDAEKILNTAPSAATYPGVPEQLGEYAAQEFRMFVVDALLDQDGGVEQLLTSNETFVNADLAAIYGLEGSFGSEFEKVTLPAQRRKGVLTQVGFLTANAASVQPDPIHRGTFIAQRIACADLPAPPDNIPELPSVTGQTNRQAIEELTEQAGSNCASCHSTLINPFGFPFENYDAVGGFRTDDNGFDVDPSATVVLDGETAQVADAIELIDTLAASQSVHECYARHWVEFASGRRVGELDEPLIERLGALSAEDGEPVKELLVQLVLSQPFLTRATEELQ